MASLQFEDSVHFAFLPSAPVPVSAGPAINFGAGAGAGGGGDGAESAADREPVPVFDLCWRPTESTLQLRRNEQTIGETQSKALIRVVEELFERSPNPIVRGRTHLKHQQQRQALTAGGSGSSNPLIEAIDRVAMARTGITTNNKQPATPPSAAPAPAPAPTPVPTTAPPKAA